MQSVVSGGGGEGAAVTPNIAGLLQRPLACRLARIHLLGPMRATSYLGDDILPRSKKGRALLGYLCLTPGTRSARLQLARTLWDRTGDEHARGSLRHALLELCEAMGPLAAELISAGRAAISLNADACWIDAVAMLDPASRGSELGRFCTGQLLEGLDGLSVSFDRWLLRERTRFSEITKGSHEPSSAVAPFYKDSVPPRTEVHTHHSLPGRNRLRIAVLPFEGRDVGKSAERGNDFAFSLSHDIAAALARFRWFDVITPASFICRPLVSFTSDHLLQRKQLDYVVDGAVTRVGRLFRINVRLLDLIQCTQPIWAEDFELPSNELHRLNEMITGRVVGRIDPIILFIEGQPNRREHYGATGLLFLAIPLLYSMDRDKFEHAGELIHRAMEIDPQNAMALAWAAFWRISLVGQGWAQDIVATLEVAETLCLKAIELDAGNAEALGIYAHTCAWKKDFEAAVHYFDRSLRLNPNLAFIWVLSAATYCYIGEPLIALQRLERYRDLAPFDPYFCVYEAVYAIAYLVKGDYEQAALVARRAVKTNPDFSAGYKPLIAALGHLGRADEAKPYVAKLLSLERSFTVEHFAKTYPLKREVDRRRYARGLRLAGIPER
jgi:TolB-like protein/cytochrome c-type biogenesis protein CcmH/NrfG